MKEFLVSKEGVDLKGIIQLCFTEDKIKVLVDLSRVWFYYLRYKLKTFIWCPDIQGPAAAMLLHQ